MRNSAEICIKIVKRGRFCSLASGPYHSGWRIFFSGPSRGCEAIRNSEFRWAPMVINGKNRNEISLGGWVTQAAAHPLRSPLGSALLPKPSSDWVGSKELQQTVLFRAFAAPHVCEPASQLLNSPIGCLHKRHCYKYTCLVEVAGAEDEEDTVGKRTGRTLRVIYSVCFIEENVKQDCN